MRENRTKKGCSALLTPPAAPGLSLCRASGCLLLFQICGSPQTRIILLLFCKWASAGGLELREHEARAWHPGVGGGGASCCNHGPGQAAWFSRAHLQAAEPGSTLWDPPPCLPSLISSPRTTTSSRAQTSACSPVKRGNHHLLVGEAFPSPGTVLNSVVDVNAAMSGPWVSTHASPGLTGDRNKHLGWGDR